MASQLIYRVQQAADIFLKVKSEAQKTWRSPCQCPDPGTQDECLNCPGFRSLVEQMQSMLSPNPMLVMSALLPPERSQPYSDEVKQQCCELYSCGYSLQQIQKMTGVANLKEMRLWLREVGLMKEVNTYPEATKTQCLQLYQSGLVPHQIEEQTGTPADVVKHWVERAGLSRPKPPYSDTEKQLCLDLYLQGKSYKAIESITKVSAQKVRGWVQRSGIKRDRIFGGGRSKVYSPEFRQKCLDLLCQGKTLTQIETMLGVSAKTLRRWVREASCRS
jgi:transposase-like protein